MKKGIIIVFLTLFCATLFAQKIPSKLLRGIETSKDEFTGETTYSAKNCCLSIVQDKDSVTLYISLSCSSFDTPVKLKKLYVLTNGVTKEIEGNLDYKEIPTRVMTANATGTFGTASYRGAQFGTRINYVETWKDNAANHMTVINSIVDNLGKVKFEGENQSLVMEFSSKDAKRMKSLLVLFDYLRNGSIDK